MRLRSGCFACYLSDTLQVIVFLQIQGGQSRYFRCWRFTSLGKTHRFLARCSRQLSRAKWFFLLDEHLVWIKLDFCRGVGVFSHHRLASAYAQWPELKQGDWMIDVKALGGGHVMVCAIKRPDFCRLMGPELAIKRHHFVGISAFCRCLKWAKMSRVSNQAMLFVDNSGGVLSAIILLRQAKIVRYSVKIDASLVLTFSRLLPLLSEYLPISGVLCRLFNARPLESSVHAEGWTLVRHVGHGYVADHECAHDGDRREHDLLEGVAAVWGKQWVGWHRFGGVLEVVS